MNAVYQLPEHPEGRSSSATSALLETMQTGHSHQLLHRLHHIIIGSSLVCVELGVILHDMDKQHSHSSHTLFHRGPQSD
jgi:hypothetical protein